MPASDSVELQPQTIHSQSVHFDSKSDLRPGLSLTCLQASNPGSKVATSKYASPPSFTRYLASVLRITQIIVSPRSHDNPNYETPHTAWPLSAGVSSARTNAQGSPVQCPPLHPEPSSSLSRYLYALFLTPDSCLPYIVTYTAEITHKCARGRVRRARKGFGGLRQGTR